MGDTKKTGRKTNHKVYERKVKIAFFTLGILTYVGLLIMGIFQKITEPFKRD